MTIINTSFVTSLLVSFILILLYLCDFAHTLADVLLLHIVAGKREGARVGCARLIEAIEPSQKIGARGVKEVIMIQLSTSADFFDQTQTSLQPFAHRN